MSDVGLQAEARHRVLARRNFARTMVVFAVLAVVLVAIWSLTGAEASFWPVWPIGALAVAAVFIGLHAFGVVGTEPRQSDVDAEVERLRRRG
jgi:uncharacterized membrane protein